MGLFSVSVLGRWGEGFFVCWAAKAWRQCRTDTHHSWRRMAERIVEPIWTHSKDDDDDDDGVSDRNSTRAQHTKCDTIVNGLLCSSIKFLSADEFRGRLLLFSFQRCCFRGTRQRRRHGTCTFVGAGGAYASRAASQPRLMRRYPNTEHMLAHICHTPKRVWAFTQPPRLTCVCFSACRLCVVALALRRLFSRALFARAVFAGVLALWVLWVFVLHKGATRDPVVWVGHFWKHIAYKHIDDGGGGIAKSRSALIGGRTETAVFSEFSHTNNIFTHAWDRHTRDTRHSDVMQCVRYALVASYLAAAGLVGWSRGDSLFLLISSQVQDSLEYLTHL